jgi:hypothetical protein
VTDYIGEWVARDRPGSKQHIVESEITDRLVTRCGRQMKLEIGGRGLLLISGYPLCKVCKGKD